MSSMKILVPIKRVPDPFAKIRLRADGSGIDTTGIRFEINPFDEIAVEEAVRIQEKHGAEVVVASIGTSEWEEQLRKALAMGADRAILVETEALLDSLSVARILSALYEKEKPHLILMGKQAVDDDNNQAGQMLSALLDLPQATCASAIEIQGDVLRVTRETDTGEETLEMPLPAVVTTDLRLNQPRYVPLPGIIKARSKPLEKIPLETLGITPKCSIRIEQWIQPEPRKAGRKVSNVEELIKLLKEEAGVI
jgi:electron transfer flavoprotein beta subunit